MKRMLVNLREPEESRIAVMDDGRLEEIYVERADLPTLSGNVYLGRVVNVEPGIQAAFVDLGLPLKGFLHASDVVPAAVGIPADPTPRPRPRRPKLRASPGPRPPSPLRKGPGRPPAPSACPSRRSSSAATTSWCRSRRRASARRVRP
jgi:ribonuclease E